MLDLSRVTLLFVETRAHEITKRVIADCLSKANFGDVLIYTDTPDRFFDIPEARILKCDDFATKHLAGEFYYGKAMEIVTTDFALMMEWDAGIGDPTKWKPEFFDYDYIGAPWPVKPAEMNRLDVGNGGFALMSKRLGHFVCENLHRFPVDTDWTLCRRHRPDYEAAGFKWPGRDLASCFAWELGPRNPEHFGYHGAFTWQTVLPKEEIVARAKLMLKTDYLTVKLRGLYKTAPWIIGEFTPEELAQFTKHVPPSHMLKPRIPGMMSAQHRAAMRLMEAQRRGFITHAQKQGLKA